MTVFIQNLATNLFLNMGSTWGPMEEAYEFRTPAFAVDYCMMQGLREVRVIVNWGNPEETIFLDVHGTDLNGLRQANGVSRSLRTRRERLRAELDGLGAEVKERRKQFPFNGKAPAKPAETSASDNSPPIT
jgi:hypothetical protein